MLCSFWVRICTLPDNPVDDLTAWKLFSSVTELRYLLVYVAPLNEKVGALGVAEADGVVPVRLLKVPNFDSAITSAQRSPAQRKQYSAPMYMISRGPSELTRGAL